MIVGGAVLLLAGCGGSGKTASTHTSSTSASTTTSASAATPRTGLVARVLTNNELPGFTASQPPTVQTNPRLYLAGDESGPQLATDTARLERLGFKGAVNENLNGSGVPGLSVVEQLGSVAAARSELASNVRSLKTAGGTYATFPVSGIPGAVGYSISSPQGVGINILWADGPYYYLVGEELSTLVKSSQTALIAAARHLYQRTHG
jgi:hypothetical protein